MTEQTNSWWGGFWNAAAQYLSYQCGPSGQIGTVRGDGGVLSVTLRRCACSASTFKYTMSANRVTVLGRCTEPQECKVPSARDPVRWRGAHVGRR
jgi:hypothetical protein